MKFKLQLREKKLLRRCWPLMVKRQRKDPWKPTMKKRGELKGVYIRAKKKINEEFRREC